MHEDTGTEAPPQPREYTLWQHPFRDLRVYLHRTVLRAISFRALQSLKSKEASEIGGILRGTVSVGPNELTATIVEAEFVRSEGPLYNRTRVDYEALLRALDRQTNQAELSIIGYFRSHIREDLCLSSEDKDLIERNIRDPNSIFLLVRPFDIGTCMAAFFFWENGKLQTDESDLEVPFLALEERIGKSKIFDADRGSKSFESGNTIGANNEKKAPNGLGRKESLPPPERNDVPAPELISKPVVQIPPGTQMMTVLASGTEGRPRSGDREPSFKQSQSLHASGKRRRPLLGLAIALVSMVVVVSCVSLMFPALRSYLPARLTYSRSTSIDLSVSRATDGHLDISWNRNAPELAQGQGARITISDGSLLKEVDMDNTQLHLGKLAYFPNSADVQFRLEVYLDSKRSLAESVRVISPASKTSGVELIAQPASRSVGGPFPVRSRASSASSPPNVISAKIPSRIDSKSPLTFAANRPMPQIHKEALPPQAPLLSTAEPTPSHSSALASLPSAPPFVTPRPAAKSAPATLQTGDTSAYVPPRPIKKVMPSGIYQGLPQVVYETTQIEVEVNIDVTGRVRDAHRVQNGKKANVSLVSSAVSAAKQWTFEPAMMHGKPVAADHVLVFVFHPDSQ